MINLHDYVEKFGKDASIEKVTAAVMRGERKLVRAFVELGVATVIAQIRHSKRKLVKVAVAPKPVPFNTMKLSEKVMIRAKTDLDGVLASWVIDGVVLGLVTKAKLMEEAQRDRAKGDGLYANVAFYEALSQRMTDGQTVREAWSAEQVEALKASIWKAAA